MWVVYLIAVVFVIGWLVFEFVFWLEEDKSFTKYVLSLYKMKNKIYQCESCKKLYREYQKNLQKEVNGSSNCPHCDVYLGYFSRSINEIKWMNTHPDCPKINWLHHLKIKNTIRQIKANQKTIEEQKFFEEYNKIDVDFSWIENLQRRYK